MSLDMDIKDIIDRIMATVLNGKSWVPNGLLFSSAASSIWENKSVIKCHVNLNKPLLQLVLQILENE